MCLYYMIKIKFSLHCKMLGFAYSASFISIENKFNIPDCYDRDRKLSVKKNKFNEKSII